MAELVNGATYRVVVDTLGSLAIVITRVDLTEIERERDAARAERDQMVRLNQRKRGEINEIEREREWLEIERDNVRRLDWLLAEARWQRDERRKERDLATHWRDVFRGQVDELRQRLAAVAEVLVNPTASVNWDGVAMADVSSQGTVSVVRPPVAHGQDPNQTNVDDPWD